MQVVSLGRIGIATSGIGREVGGTDFRPTKEFYVEIGMSECVKSGGEA